MLLLLHYFYNMQIYITEKLRILPREPWSFCHTIYSDEILIDKNTNETVFVLARKTRHVSNNAGC
jgi:hypothetical protein